MDIVGLCCSLVNEVKNGPKNSHQSRLAHCSGNRSVRLAISVPSLSGHCQASPDLDSSGALLSCRSSRELIVAYSGKVGVIGK